MTIKREGAITARGNALTLLGAELKVGDSAPDFSLTAQDMSTVTLADSAGKTRLLIVVPSLDTPVCAVETAEFNKRLNELADDYAVLLVSKDLPQAQKRFCGSENITNITTLSTYKDNAFGEAYGVLMDGSMLLARAIFLISPDGKISYTQLVPEVTDEPDYDAVFEAISAAV